jgi:hypothetical protein
MAEATADPATTVSISPAALRGNRLGLPRFTLVEPHISLVSGEIKCFR